MTPGTGTETSYWVPAWPVVAIVLALYWAGYQFYAKYLSRRLFGTEEDDSPTPAHSMRDDVDYVPAKRSVLFGHHFTSVAGAAPIVGPAIAVIWGWLPAVLWVALGAIFMGAVQDMGSLAVSARNRGRSVGDLAGGLIGPRARTLFLLIAMFALWIVLAVFALVIAGLFVNYPLTVLPINIEILVAVVIGFAIHKYKEGVLPLSLGALILLYAVILVGSKHQPETYSPSNWPLFDQIAESRLAKAMDEEALDAGERAAQAMERGLALNERRTATEAERVAAFRKAADQTRFELQSDTEFLEGRRKEFDKLWWLCFLFLYAFAASVLPVWTLLQPRDFINSHQLIVGLALVYGGFFVASWGPWWSSGDMQATVFFHAPAFRASAESGAPSIFPFLFVTIACGAISGFHSLVASGTSSKQLNSFRDVRPVGYGSMMGEASLGLLAVIACTTGLGFAASLKAPEVGLQYSGVDEWFARYATFAGMQGLDAKVGAFVDGGGGLLAQLFIKFGADPKTAWEIAKIILGVMVISFAATSLDTATRVQRFVISELGEAYKLNFLKDRYAASAVAVGSAFLLAVSRPGGAGGMVLWPIFGSLNQLIAALALLTLTVYLYRSRKPIIYCAVPALVVASIVFCALAMQFKQFVFPTFGPPNYFLGAVTGMITILASWLFLEAAALFASKARRTLPIGFQ